jgi:hypothetical protein
MNDIYEQKAKKYKYKYLKLKRLKRELEYTGEGGMFGNVYNDFLNLFGKKTDTKAIEPKEIVYGEHHNLPASDNQKQFRQTLVSLQTKIKDEIVPLYKNKEIIGKINNINFTMNKFSIEDNTIETPGIVKSTDKVKDNIKILVNDEKYSDYYPPIIKCFYKIDNNKNKNITKTELFKLLGICLTSIAAKSRNEVILEKDKGKVDLFYQMLLKELLKLLDKNADVQYNMYNVYKLCIQPFVKDIDYYALTKVICDLYDEYKINNKDDAIKQIKTEKNNTIDELFGIFKANFLNNAINKNNFLTQLDDIIKVIKE